jgi:predicted PurR-regulated permease PerM
MHPQQYRDGFLALIPLDKRDRARDLLGRMGRLLWWWLGRLLGMVIVGVLSGEGLRLLGVPLALTLQRNGRNPA